MLMNVKEWPARSRTITKLQLVQILCCCNSERKLLYLCKEYGVTLCEPLCINAYLII